MPTAYAGPHDNVIVIDGGQALQTSNSFNDQSGRWGLDLILAEGLNDPNNEIVKTCAGATDIDAWQPSGVLMTAHNAICQNATVGSEHIVIWIQGEQDAFNNISQADYQAKEANLFNSILLKNPGAKIISVLLNPSAGPWPGTTNVNNAKIANASAFPEVTTVGNNYDLLPDNIHLSQAGFEALSADILALI